MKISIIPRRHVLPTRIFAALVLALLAVFSTGTVASAHDELIGSTPETGSTVTQAPKEIVLNFSGQLQTLANDGGTVVVITNSAGEKIENTLEVKGRTVTITPATALTSDEYTVASRVISSDGHPIEKSVKFTVDAPGATTDSAATDSTIGAEPTADASEPATAPENAAAAGGVSPIIWIIVGVVIAGAAIAVLVNFARRNNMR